MTDDHNDEKDLLDLGNGCRKDDNLLRDSCCLNSPFNEVTLYNALTVRIMECDQTEELIRVAGP